MNPNKQLSLNFALSIINFVIGTAITFFLTPYIVSTLGRAAYGFIGLSSNIIGYTSLITIALNAMAGRFIRSRNKSTFLKRIDDFKTPYIIM